MTPTLAPVTVFCLRHCILGNGLSSYYLLDLLCYVTAAIPFSLSSVHLDDLEERAMITHALLGFGSHSREHMSEASGHVGGWQGESSWELLYGTMFGHEVGFQKGVAPRFTFMKAL